jgi:hypothetical protein
MGRRLEFDRWGSSSKGFCFGIVADRGASTMFGDLFSGE